MASQTSGPAAAGVHAPLDLSELLSRVRALPALPAAVMELMRCLEDPAIDIDSVAARIARDQGLTLRVLRVANSPFYGLSRPVASISDAMVILGVRSVRMLVTAAAVASALRPDTASGFDLKRYWWHALGAALAARAVARRAGAEAEVAFLAGLLHDCGKLVLACVAPGAYGQLCAECTRRQCRMHAAEAECLGLTHAQIGAALVQHWRFAPEIAAAVAAHHQPAPTAALNAAVALADALCRGTDAAPKTDAVLALAGQLRLDPPALEGCVEEMRSGQAAAAAIVGQ